MNSNMRLPALRISSSDSKIIKEKTLEIFGSSASVFLFGSRTDDTKKGGDIDLFIETEEVKDSVKKKITLMTELQFKLGERKIDIIMASKNDINDIPLIVKIARETGIRL